MKPAFILFLPLLLFLFVAACQNSESEKKETSVPLAENPQNLGQPFDLPPELPHSNLSSEARELQVSWNLVSFPITDETDVQSFLSNNNGGAIQSIWKWDRNLGTVGNWRVYPQISNFESFSTLDPNVGYWVRVNRSFDLTGTGIVQQDFNFQLGWNLIGYSHAAPEQKVANFLEQGNFWANSCGDGKTVNSVWAWTEGTWAVYFPGDTLENPAQLNALNKTYSTKFQFLNTLEPGIGLWVNAARGNSPFPPNLSDCEDDYPDIASQAAPIPVGQTVSGHLGDADDRDWFQFTREANTSYHIKVTRGSITGAFYVYCSSICSSDSIYLQKTIGNVIVEPGAEGSISFYVVSWRRQTGTYQVEVQSFQDDHGNTKDSATVITEGQSIDGNLEVEGESDKFVFTPNKGTAYQIKASRKDIIGNFSLRCLQCVSLELLSISGAVTVTDEDNGIVFVKSDLLPEDFQFEFTVNSWQNNTGTYSIQVLRITNDHGLSGPSTEINEDQLVSGNLELKGEQDYFSFTPTLGESYQLQLIRGTHEGELQLISNRLEFSDWSTLSFDKMVLAATETEVKKLIPFDSEQPYQFKVVSTNQKTGTYSVKMFNYQDDHGNQSNLATEISSGQTTEGRLEVSGDSDHFRFVPTEGVSYRINVKGIDLTGKINLICSDVICYPFELMAASEIAYTFTAKSNETQFFHFASLKGHTGSYSITIDSYDDDHSNNYHSPTLITQSQSYSGNLEVEQDRDYFKFETIDGNDYQIKVTRNGLIGGFSLNCQPAPVIVSPASENETGDTNSESIQTRTNSVEIDLLSNSCHGSVNVESSEESGTLTVSSIYSAPLIFYISSSDGNLGTYSVEVNPEN